MLDLAKRLADDTGAKVSIDFNGWRKADRGTDFPTAKISAADGAEIWIQGHPIISDRTNISVRGTNSRLYIADSASLDGAEIIIRGVNHCIFIGSQARLRKVLLHNKSGDGNMTLLGEGVTWESGTGLCMSHNQHIILSDDCMLSTNVSLRTDDGHGIFDAVSKELINRPAPVVLHRHVWLGGGVRVNKGTTIGEGSVIGSSSVASGLLAARSIYAGVPARLLRKEVAWSRTWKAGDVPPDLW